MSWVGVNAHVYRLADYFVPPQHPNRETAVVELAELLQRAIEDFLEQCS